MATAKKNSKGNKTAHVLNLLTAPGGTAPAPAESEAPVQEEAQPAAPSRPLLPPILEVAQANDDNLAQQIQQALEEEFIPSEPPEIPVEEVSPVNQDPPAVSGGKMNQDDIEAMLAAMSAPVQEEAPAPAPAPEPQPAPSGGKMSQDDIEAMLAAMSAPAQEEAPAPAPEPEPMPEPAPGPAAPASKPEPAPEDEMAYVNVMQILVEEKAPEYIKKFGLCTCKHCEADVKALTLSNLVPKYVVLSKLDRIPMLTVYEGRFNSTVFAQLTRACKVVMDHPHHSREE